MQLWMPEKGTPQGAAAALQTLPRSYLIRFAL